MPDPGPGARSESAARLPHQCWPARILRCLEAAWSYGSTLLQYGMDGNGFLAQRDYQRYIRWEPSYLTSSPTVTECCNDPELPITVTVYVPVGVPPPPEGGGGGAGGDGWLVGGALFARDPSPPQPAAQTAMSASTSPTASDHRYFRRPSRLAST